MARNGSGTYSAPSGGWNPAVSATTIESSVFNTLLSDMETALSESIARDGQTATTAAIPFASGLNVDTISEKTGNTGVTIDSVLLKDGGITLGAAGTVIFEGTTADAFETTLTAGDPSADRTLTMPDATDTLVGKATTDTLTNKTLTSPTLTSAVLNTAVSGTAVLDEDDLSSDSATQLATQQSIKAYVDSQITLPRSYGAGCITSQDADADHDVNVTAGAWRNADNDGDLTLTSEITKQIDATWAAGDDAGGLSSSLTAPANDTWYYVHLIEVAGSVDVGFDTSLTAANLIADHSATSYRYIGRRLTDGSANILPLLQVGDFFWWDVPIDDLSNGTIATAGTALTLSVPTGVKLPAIFNVSPGSVNSTLMFYPPDTTGVQPGSTAPPIGQASSFAAGENATQVICLTNTSAQVTGKADSGGNNTDASITTTGWIDRRGKDD